MLTSLLQEKVASMSNKSGASPQQAQRSGFGRDLDLRLVVALALAVGLALYFWTQSRYPSLGAKALSGVETPISGLAFDILIRTLPGSGLWERMWANTANWVFTNLKGMTFGVFFGASALTILSLIRRRSFNGRFANAAMGAAIGAPLGVCVNCAVPIALGFHTGRMRLETTLAAMIASPTLNVIVVTMSFALLPLNVALAKLAVSLCMVLVGIPLLCRFVLHREAEAAQAGEISAKLAGVQKTGLFGWLAGNLAPQEPQPGHYPPLQAIAWLMRTYARNLFFIALITVPLMLGAAVLGAIFVELVRPSALILVMPRSGDFAIIGAMLALAVVLSFAPAPIAFDVILTASLLGMGLQDHFAAVAVVALGSFSVYAFLVIWRAISARTALALWAMCVAAAVLAGAITVKTGGPFQAWERTRLIQTLANGPQIAWPEIASSPPPAPSTVAPVANRPLDFDLLDGTPVARVTLRPIPLAQASVGATDPVFTRVYGPDIGLDLHDEIVAPWLFVPFGLHGGIAAADFDDDGWVDLALRRSGLQGGIALYRNVGGRFERQPFDAGPPGEVPALTLAFVDLIGNSNPDLVLATDGRGVFIYENRGGRFDQAPAIKLDTPDTARTRAMAFADFDRDGRLDIALGNNALTTGDASNPNKAMPISANLILLNRSAGRFDRRTINQFTGQTLTLLASDINRDGRIDLLAGNDVAGTDAITEFFEGGTLMDRAGRDLGLPYPLSTTMSYDEGDWNNDLIPDYYGGQIGMASRLLDEVDQRKNIENLCALWGQDAGWSDAQRTACQTDAGRLASHKLNSGGGGLSNCTNADAIDQTICAAEALFWHLSKKRTPAPDVAAHKTCTRALARIPLVQNLCNVLLDIHLPKPPAAVIEDTMGAPLRNSNTLFTGQPDRTFVDLAEAQGVDLPGWTWDARFADLDQDGWQDLSIMTGYWSRLASGDSNVFYHNVAGQFELATLAFGLEDLSPSFSAVRFDYDRDGDIDMIRALSGPHVVVHRNDRPAGAALWVALRQSGGNTQAIGARVTICTNGARTILPGSCQTRPIRAGGGFASFDPVAAHFGLGAAREVSLIQVDWPDGASSTLAPKDLLQGEIVITR